MIHSMMASGGGGLKMNVVLLCGILQRLTGSNILVVIPSSLELALKSVFSPVF
jgi:hypothetical protein